MHGLTEDCNRTTTACPALHEHEKYLNQDGNGTGSPDSNRSKASRQQCGLADMETDQRVWSCSNLVLYRLMSKKL